MLWHWRKLQQPVVSETEKKSVKEAVRLDTLAVVEGLGGAVRPARAAVGLVADVVDHVLALGPVGA